jgi:hypothetical protein
MFKEPIENFQLQPLLPSDLLSRQIKTTITKRILVVPDWLSCTFDMFQNPLQEVVAEEFIKRADCRVRNMIEMEH